MRQYSALWASWALTLAATLAAATNVGGHETAATSVPQVSAERLAIAESVLEREEAASTRMFDESFRARALATIASLPMEVLLQAETQENGGLGLNVLGDTQADLVYTPVTPCRILDTRVAGGTIGAGTTRDFRVTGTSLSSQGGSATGCGVPYGPVTAAVINFAAVNPAGPGNVRMTPYGNPIPKAAIVNFTAGVTIANGLAVAICDPSASTCPQDFTIQVDVNAIHLVADVQGYFQRVSTGGVGTALLADSAVTTVKMAAGSVTAPKIANGVVVRSLNSQTDAVTLAGSNGLSVSQGSGTVTVTSSATDANTPSTIVARDSLGNFSAGSMILAGDVALPNTAGPYVGVITLGGSRFLHNFGTRNTFTGAQAGNTSMTGAGNSAVGYQALQANTTGWGNAALGEQTLRANTTGYANTAVGDQVLQANTEGYDNSAFGDVALYWNTTGHDNSAVGYSALGSNTTGQNNSALGSYSLANNTTGQGNSAVGMGALNANTTGVFNVAVGSAALTSNTTGDDNAAFGYAALLFSSTASQNSAFGYQALYANTTGSGNSALGVGALHANTTGFLNSAVGNAALYSSTTGQYNVALGYQAGYNQTTGSNNIYIDSPGVAAESGAIHVGRVGTHSATYVAGIYTATSASGAAVYVNSNGQLGTTTSSRRYKEQIADMAAESDVLMKLRPVSFYYKPELDGTHTRQYGLVAEEVAEIAPELVLNDENGAPQTVRYHFVNAMLLNEVQKQQRQIQEQDEQLRAQEAQVQELKERLARLEARLAQ